MSETTIIICLICWIVLNAIASFDAANIINKQKVIIEHYKKYPLLHSEEARILLEFCLNSIRENAVRYGDYEKAAECRDLINKLKNIENETSNF